MSQITPYAPIVPTCRGIQSKAAVTVKVIRRLDIVMPLEEELPEGFGLVEIAKDRPKKTSKAKTAQLSKPNKMLETKSLSGSYTGSTLEVR
jgi:hypothetical protein